MALRDKAKFNTIKVCIPMPSKFKSGTELFRKAGSSKEYFQKGSSFVSGQSFPLSKGVLRSDVDGEQTYYYYAAKEK